MFREMLRLNAHKSRHQFRIPDGLFRGSYRSRHTHPKESHYLSSCDSNGTDFQHQIDLHDLSIRLIRVVQRSKVQLPVGSHRRGRHIYARA